MENALPAIPAKRYFTIGEVSDLCFGSDLVVQKRRAIQARQLGVFVQMAWVPWVGAIAPRR